MSNIDRVVNAALDLNMSIRNDHMRQMLGAAAYASTYCTVRIDCGRQTGKTDYIVNNATDQDLVIVGSPDARNWYRAQGVNAYLLEQLPRLLRGKRVEIDRVFVDEPYTVFRGPTDRYALYSITAGHPSIKNDITFILLGS